VWTLVIKRDLNIDKAYAEYRKEERRSLLFSQSGDWCGNRLHVHIFPSPLLPGEFVRSQDIDAHPLAHTHCERGRANEEKEEEMFFVVKAGRKEAAPL
jgi:hypothetical protein